MTWRDDCKPIIAGVLSEAARIGMTAAEYLETQQAEMVARDGVIPWREVEAIARLVWRVA